MATKHPYVATEQRQRVRREQTHRVCAISRSLRAPSRSSSRALAVAASSDPTVQSTMPTEEPPPLYKPELIEPKKKLTFLQHCYKEPWVPIGERFMQHAYGS
jgi:hypothetical protein